MNLKELLKAMFHAYFVITTGITASTYVCSLLFKPDVRMSPADIGGILLLALISDLSFLIFYSNKELTKKQMLLRLSIHIPVILLIITYFAHSWNWLNINRPIEVIVFIFIVLGVYTTVLTITFFKDNSTAHKLNEGLKNRYHQ